MTSLLTVIRWCRHWKCLFRNVLETLNWYFITEGLHKSKKNYFIGRRWLNFKQGPYLVQNVITDTLSDTTTNKRRFIPGVSSQLLKKVK